MRRFLSVLLLASALPRVGTAQDTSRYGQAGSRLFQNCHTLLRSRPADRSGTFFQLVRTDDLQTWYGQERFFETERTVELRFVRSAVHALRFSTPPRDVVVRRADASGLQERVTVAVRSTGERLESADGLVRVARVEAAGDSLCGADGVMRLVLPRSCSHAMHAPRFSACVRWLFALLLGATTSCQHPEPPQEVRGLAPATASGPTARPAGAQSIRDVSNYLWRPREPTTGAYGCEMRFEAEYALYSFHGQCVYYFFTWTTFAPAHQQIELRWSYKADCLLNMALLEVPHGGYRPPAPGAAFATYRLLDDTTLGVVYAFPGWVRQVNQIAQDSLFPQRLYLTRPEDL